MTDAAASSPAGAAGTGLPALFQLVSGRSSQLAGVPWPADTGKVSSRLLAVSANADRQIIRASI
jgi:hypothetical protein